MRIYVENSKGINTAMKINVNLNTSILFCMLVLNIEKSEFKLLFVRAPKSDSTLWAHITKDIGQFKENWRALLRGTKEETYE